MKRLLFFIFFLVCVSSQGVTQTIFSSVEDLSEKIIKSFRRSDTTYFNQLHSNDSIIVSNFSKSLGFDFSTKVESQLYAILKEGQEKGIDWSKVKFVKVEYITSYDGPFEIAQPAVVIFQHRLFRYAFEVNCSKLKGSWSIVPSEDKEQTISMRKF